jgi:hypothetical protein
MRKALGVLVVATSFLSSVAAAQLINSFHFIPVVTKAPGLNSTFWQSDVTVTNVGTSKVRVGMKYFPSDVANTFDPQFPFQFDLEAGKTALWEDVLGWYWKRFPGPTQGKGFLVIADVTAVNCNVPSPPSSYSGLLAVTSRTYNRGDPKGTYSTAADPNLTGLNFTTFPSIITGVRHTGTTAPGFRTNLSVANFSTDRIRVLIRVFGGNGAPVAPESLQTIEALSFKQWSLTNLGVSNIGSYPVGRIEVRLDPVLVADPCTSVTDTFCANPCDPVKCPTKYAMRSQPTFFAYASMTDNGTGDGTILSPVVDWQGYSKYTSDYQKAHCPDKSVIAPNSAVANWLREHGLLEPDTTPTFKKLKK